MRPNLEQSKPYKVQLGVYRLRTKAFLVRKASCSFLKSSFTAVVLPPSNCNTNLKNRNQHALIQHIDADILPGHAQYTVANWALEMPETVSDAEVEGVDPNYARSMPFPSFGVRETVNEIQ